MGLLRECLVGVCVAVVTAFSGVYVVCAGNSGGIPEVEYFSISISLTKTLFYI